METVPLMQKKIVLVGDGICGKTCLLMVFTQNKFPIEYVPTVIDNCIKDIRVDNVMYSLELIDTSGQEDYERLRILIYNQINVFVLCFAVDNLPSFLNIRHYWMKELTPYNLPIVLVATKIDLRNSDSTLISTECGQSLAKEINAFSYFECSALHNIGIEEIFASAATARAPKSGKLCNWKCFEWKCCCPCW